MFPHPRVLSSMFFFNSLNPEYEIWRIPVEFRVAPHKRLKESTNDTPYLMRSIVPHVMAMLQQVRPLEAFTLCEFSNRTCFVETDSH